MRYLKHIVVIVAIGIGTFLLTQLLDESEGGYNFFIWTAILILVVLSFNIYARDYLRYKSYFTNKLNIFAAKTSRSFTTEIPKATIIDKLVEVLKENAWKVKEVDQAKGEILATTGMTFRSWGENIYVEVVEKQGENEVRIHSVALFQVYMWGKNEDNLDQFLNKFEDSLIV